jgi:hypothetical protein
MLNPEIYGTLSEKQARILKGRDIQELVSFFEICHTIREISFAMANSPEHRHIDQEMLENLFVSHLELIRESLMDELEGRKPKTAGDLERRNECLCKWNMMSGSFTDAAKLLVDLVANERNLPKHIE